MLEIMGAKVMIETLQFLGCLGLKSWASGEERDSRAFVFDFKECSSHSDCDQIHGR